MATALELSSSEIQGLCRRYLHAEQSNPDFEVISYELQRTSDSPAGFLGSHFYLQVTLRLVTSETDAQLKQLRFFAKAAPSGNDAHMDYVEDFGVFKKEITVYQHVLPELQSYCSEVAPKCYYADKNLLVFENLAEQGYSMGATRDGLLNYEQLHCALKTLAALHAGSIIQELRTGKPLTQTQPSAVVENAYPSDKPAEHLRMIHFRNTCKVLEQYVQTLPKYQSNMPQVLANFTKQLCSIFELIKPSKRYQNALLHGDLWANNMMFQNGKYGELPQQCRFVDFQLARYAPPVLDVLTLLTIPTTSAFRKAHMNDLLADYYSFMTAFFKRAGLDIAQCMNEQQFYESVEEYRIVGIIESCLFCHLVILAPQVTQLLTSTADGFSDFFSRKRIDICMENFQNDQLYRARMVDMLEDFVDNFVLSQDKKEH